MAAISVGGEWEERAALTQLYPLTSVMSANRGCHSHWHLHESSVGNHPAVPTPPPGAPSARPVVSAVDVTRFIIHSLAANMLPSYPVIRPPSLSHSGGLAHFDPCTLFP